MRDLILQPDLVPNDIDIATDAAFEDIRKIIPSTIAIGKAFGVGLVTIDDFSFEVAMFRKESEYTDHRHPSQVTPGTLEEDSIRRDFTINSLYLDPISLQIADFHNGISDLGDRKLRCVGNPSQRLQEDPLRILRLFRFASNLDFEIDQGTLQAACSLRAGLLHISRERVLLEISKIKPTAVNKFKNYFKLIQDIVIRESATPPYSKADTNEQIKYESSLELKNLNSEMLQHPGTLLALICINNEGFASRDWNASFKSWPFSLKEKAHLNLITRFSEGVFILPRSSQDTQDTVTLRKWLEHFKWLFRQNRIALSEFTWIIDNITTPENDRPDVLKKLRSTLTKNEGQQTLSSALEDKIAPHAKTFRQDLQNWAKDKPKEALGWARLFVDISLLLNHLQINDTDRPLLLRASNPLHLDVICSAALALCVLSSPKKQTALNTYIKVQRGLNKK